MPIQDEGEIIPEFSDQNINRFISKLININPFILVDLSHEHEFWKKNKMKLKVLAINHLINSMISRKHLMTDQHNENINNGIKRKLHWKILKTIGFELQ